MTEYDVFCRHYDQVMFSAQVSGDRIRAYIKKHHAKAKTLLELACGTGRVLEILKSRYEVYGLDRSQGMLKVAKRKIPASRLFKGDMASFSIPLKFDVILCVGDSINHLLKASRWRQCFHAAKGHLNPGGLLIFDMNTPEKLKLLPRYPPLVVSFKKNLMVMMVSTGKKGVTNWNTRVFERQRDKRYRLYEENIHEAAFPEKDVRGMLKQANFRLIKMDKTEMHGPNRDIPGRYFFIARNS